MNGLLESMRLYELVHILSHLSIIIYFTKIIFINSKYNTPNNIHSIIVLNIISMGYFHICTFRNHYWWWERSILLFGGLKLGSNRLNPNKRSMEMVHSFSRSKVNSDMDWNPIYNVRRPWTNQLMSVQTPAMLYKHKDNICEWSLKSEF